MTKERKEALKKLSRIWTPIESRKFQEGDRTDFRYWDSLDEYVSAHPAPQNFVPFQVRHFYAEQKKRIGGLLNKYRFVTEVRGVFDNGGKEVDFDARYRERYPEYVVGEIPDSYRGVRRNSRQVKQFIKEGEAAHEATNNSTAVFKERAC